MKKMQVKTYKMLECTLENGFRCSARVKSGYLVTYSRKTAKSARRAFIALCNRLGIPRDSYEFKE